MLKPKYLKAFVLCFVFICHIASLLIPASAMSHAYNTSNNPDLAPICNGSGSIQWISLSEYDKTGKITFVTPSNENSTLPNTASDTENCSLCSFFSSIDNDDHTTIPDHVITQLPQFTVTLSSPITHIAKTPLNATSRAPPTFL